MYLRCFLSDFSKVLNDNILKICNGNPQRGITNEPLWFLQRFVPVHIVVMKCLVYMGNPTLSSLCDWDLSLFTTSKILHSARQEVERAKVNNGWQSMSDNNLICIWSTSTFINANKFMTTQKNWTWALKSGLWMYYGTLLKAEVSETLQFITWCSSW